MDDNAPHQHATRGEIINLAAAEGHDADIPSNVGSIHQVPSHTSIVTLSIHSRDPEKAMASAMEKDLEKGEAAASLSSEEVSPDGNEDDDPNIVFWDGPDDPQNPMNWRPMKKWGTVTLVSAITFLTPLASSMFAPGVPEVMKTFNSTDSMLEGFMVSVYVLGFAFGPMSMYPRSYSVTYNMLIDSSNRAVIGNVWTAAALPQLQCVIRGVHGRSSSFHGYGNVHCIPIFHGLFWRSTPCFRRRNNCRHNSS